MGDEVLNVEEVMANFAELGINLNSELDYRELVKHMVGGDGELKDMNYKPEVVIRDARIEEGDLRGYAYAHPKLGEGPVRSSKILSVNYDERATARVETRNTMYVVGPTGWEIRPDDHPFNAKFSVGEEIKVEWKGSWWDAIILEAKWSEEQYLIHYVGFDSSWDEWVTAERIKSNS
jgi:hypothetical protein